MINTIILRFQKKISLIDEKFVQNAVLKFIYPEKANLVRHRDIKKNINVSHKTVIAKLKQSKSEAESAKEVKSIAKFISISIPEFNILTNLNNAMSLN